MARLRRSRNGKKWYVEIRKRGHKGLNATFSTRAEANAWAKETEVELEKGKSVLGHRYTLDDAIAEFKTARGLSVNQINNLAWWSKVLGSKPLLSIDRSDFLTGQRKLSKVISNRGTPLSQPR